MDVPAGLGGPSQLVLTASVARRYYLDNRSKTELAQEFRISRFKVARLLEAARSSGLVRIDIGWAGVIDVELSVLLQERFCLQHSVVIDVPEGNDAELRRATP